MAEESARQEIEFTFMGKPWKVRPTFDVISSVEKATGESAMTLGRKLINYEMPLTTIAVVLYSILRPLGGPKIDEIGAAIVEDGYQELTEPVATLLVRALKGNAAHMREAAAAAGGTGSGPQTGG
jgi:hypothetical protein